MIYKPFQNLSISQLPAACLSCGACTQLCPQGIDIPDIMKKFDATLRKM